MRIFYFTSLLFLLFSQIVLANPISNSCNIASSLRLGSKGPLVVCLQEKLGIIADGSFGPKTQLALIAFQSRNNLSPDGVFGSLSNLALNAVVGGTIYASGCSSLVGYSSTTGKKCDTSSATVVLPSQDYTNNTNSVAKTNPNLTNLDQFIDVVVGVNRKKGKNEDELKSIASSLRNEVMNSNVDYNKKFKELLINESKLSSNSKTNSTLSFFDKVVSQTLSFFGIKPSVAFAGTGIPFGGRLLFPFYCAVSGNWMLTITPLPPFYTAVVSYTEGTQGFASYNIPFTTSLLGFYTPPGICSYGVVNIGTEGTITPIVGSSPL